MMNPIPRHFTATSTHKNWKGKIRCAYCKAEGWPDPFGRNPLWWGLRHGDNCKNKAEAVRKTETADRVREAFRCEAFVAHGPGHQSSSRCTRRTEHSLDGDHYVTEVVYAWTGPQAFEEECD